MAQCGLCEKEKPIRKTFKVYTAIRRQSTIKTGFKEYETRTQSPLFFQEHEYHICSACIQKYKNYELYVWVPAAVVAIFFLIAGLVNAEDSSFLDILCFGFLPPLALAYWISSSNFDIEKKLVQKAVAAREATNWKADVGWMPSVHRQQHGGPRANSSDHIVGFTEEKYQAQQKAN